MDEVLNRTRDNIFWNK